MASLCPIVANSAGGRTLASGRLCNTTPATFNRFRPTPSTTFAMSFPSALVAGGCHVHQVLKYSHTTRSMAGASVQSTRMRSWGKPKASIVDRFTNRTVEAITIAQEEARRLGHSYVGTEHLLLGLIREATGIPAKLFKSMGISLAKARAEADMIAGSRRAFHAIEIPFTPRAKRVLELSSNESREFGYIHVDSEHVLLAILRKGEGGAIRVIENLGANPTEIGKEVNRMIEAVVGSSSSPERATLEGYGTNLHKLAKEGELDPIVGRRDMIEQVARVVRRRTKNNPCLVGESGVGKTAIVQGLAQWIASDDAPQTMKGKRIIALDMERIMAPTKRLHESEERLKRLIDQVIGSSNVILFIDNIHKYVQTRYHPINILRQALARGEIQCIGATTSDEYKFHIASDPTLSRIFQAISVHEPSVDETIEILRAVQPNYETHHKLKYTNESLVAAANLSHQFISDRFLPDKAIDLIDEAGSHVRIHHSKLADEAKKSDGAPFVTKAHIMKVVSSWTRIPIEDLVKNEDDEAIRYGIECLREWNAPESDEDLGLADLSAVHTFVEEDFEFTNGFIKLMSKLREAAQRRPRMLALLKAIDDVDPRVFDRMLRVLEDGRLIDSKVDLDYDEYMMDL